MNLNQLAEAFSRYFSTHYENARPYTGPNLYVSEAEALDAAALARLAEFSTSSSAVDQRGLPHADFSNSPEHYH